MERITLEQVHALYRQLTESLIDSDTSISTMESCTSGLIASLITDTEGASAIIKGSLISYSNDVKVQFGIPAETIEQFGVYSPQTAEAMAEQAGRLFHSTVSIGVTGSFGNPDPANSDSVPGRIFYAIRVQDDITVCELLLEEPGDRFDCKLQTAYRIGMTLQELLRSRTGV